MCKCTIFSSECIDFLNFNLMCTVTFLPKENDCFIITSNRDETPKRKTIPPKIYTIDGVKLVFPKDELAGGTWIGTSEKNRLICLLNGGFTKHKRANSYKMSRGILVKNLLTSDDAIAQINDFSFEGIEPFTIILIDWNNGLQLHELVWTGVERHFTELAQKPHIWSSSTLYTNEIKNLRKQWFVDWLKENKEFYSQEIIKFHQDKTKGNTEISLKMKRDAVETVSTTCIEKSSENIIISYTDYLMSSNSSFALIPTEILQ